MNIGKVMQFATEGLKAVKSLPLAGKLAAGTLFGAGAVAGILIGDSFEKGVEVKEEVKEETELVTQPKEQADTAKVEVKEPEFKYIPPEVGKAGIAKADTCYYIETDIIAAIEYLNKNDEIQHITNFDENGNFDGYSKWFHDYNNEIDVYIYKYDKLGEYDADEIRYRDGSIETTNFYDNMVKRDLYDKNGSRISSICKYKDGTKIENKYEKDGSTITTSYKYNTPIYQVTEDKNGRLIKKKKYNPDGTLKHTIIPKYNNEGDVVRGDTIPNK